MIQLNPTTQILIKASHEDVNLDELLWTYCLAVHANSQQDADTNSGVLHYNARIEQCDKDIHDLLAMSEEEYFQIKIKQQIAKQKTHQELLLSHGNRLVRLKKMRSKVHQWMFAEEVRGQLQPGIRAIKDKIRTQLDQEIEDLEVIYNICEQKLSLGYQLNCDREKDIESLTNIKLQLETCRTDLTAKIVNDNAVLAALEAIMPRPSKFNPAETTSSSADTIKACKTAIDRLDTCMGEGENEILPNP